MANSIALFKKYIDLLDEVYKQSSKTSILDGDNTLVQAGANTNEIVVPKLSMDGLADYSRNGGYVHGDVELTMETVKFNYDRGRKFDVDAMDNEETAGVFKKTANIKKDSYLSAKQMTDKKSVSSFLKYPFSFMAIIDLVSILPSLCAINGGFKILRIVRMIRAFRVFRVFKAIRYSKNIKIIVGVFQRSKGPLVAVGTLSIVYILVSALIVLNAEPESFKSFFDAVYWATVSLTTMGYGDIYPVTTIGRTVTMLSSILGIAIVALPSGIITAGYMKEIEEFDEDDNT